MLFNKDKDTIDVLENNKKKLDLYKKQFEVAVSAVQVVIDTLTEANDEVTQQIADINLYQKELSETANELDKVKEKNNRVIQNFKSLLS